MDIKIVIIKVTYKTNSKDLYNRIKISDFLILIMM